MANGDDKKKKKKVSFSEQDLNDIFGPSGDSNQGPKHPTRAGQPSSYYPTGSDLSPSGYNPNLQPSAQPDSQPPGARPESPSWWDTFASTDEMLASGVGSSLEGLGGATQWATGGAYGSGLSEYGRELSERNTYESTLQHVGWESLADPSFYTSGDVLKAIYEGFMTSAPEMAATMGTGGGATLVAKKLAPAIAKKISQKLATLSASGKVGKAIAGTAKATPQGVIQSLNIGALEGGRTYNQLMQQGADPERASEAFGDVVADNLALSLINVPQYGALFGKGAASGGRGLMSAAGGVGAQAAGEAVEETYQGASSEVALENALREGNAPERGTLSYALSPEYLSKPTTAQQFFAGLGTGGGIAAGVQAGQAVLGRGGAPAGGPTIEVGTSPTGNEVIIIGRDPNNDTIYTRDPETGEESTFKEGQLNDVRQVPDPRAEGQLGQVPFQRGQQVSIGAATYQITGVNATTGQIVMQEITPSGTGDIVNTTAEELMQATGQTSGTPASQPAGQPGQRTTIEYKAGRNRVEQVDLVQSPAGGYDVDTPPLLSDDARALAKALSKSYPDVQWDVDPVEPGNPFSKYRVRAVPAEAAQAPGQQQPEAPQQQQPAPEAEAEAETEAEPGPSGQPPDRPARETATTYEEYLANQFNRGREPVQADFSEEELEAAGAEQEAYIRRRQAADDEAAARSAERVSAEQPPATPERTLGELEGVRVTYGRASGVLSREADGTYVVNTGRQSYEVADARKNPDQPAAAVGIAPTAQAVPGAPRPVTRRPDGTYMVPPAPGEPPQAVRYLQTNFDEAGAPASVSVANADGQARTIRDPAVVDAMIWEEFFGAYADGDPGEAEQALSAALDAAPDVPPADPDPTTPLPFFDLLAARMIPDEALRAVEDIEGGRGVPAEETRRAEQALQAATTRLEDLDFEGADNLRDAQLDDVSRLIELSVNMMEVLEAHRTRLDNLTQTPDETTESPPQPDQTTPGAPATPPAGPAGEQTAPDTGPSPSADEALISPERPDLEESGTTIPDEPQSDVETPATAPTEQIEQAPRSIEAEQPTEYSDEQLARGVWSDDPPEKEQAAREFMRRRIDAGDPIYPNRKLGMEYAVLNSDIPSGVPAPSVALANLRKGETIRFGQNNSATVESIGKTLTLVYDDGTRRRYSPDQKNWDQFQREVEGLMLSAAHGVDTGDLMTAWSRDPIAQATEEASPAEPPASQTADQPPSQPRFQTGQAVTLPVLKNPERAPDMGSQYGQDVEPAGDYVVEQETEGHVPEGWQQAEVRLENPLVIPVDAGTQISYKRELSDRYEGKTGPELSDALRADGYDAVITRYPDGSTGEIVLLAGQREQPTGQTAGQPASQQAEAPEAEADIPPLAEDMVPEAIREEAEIIRQGDNGLKINFPDGFSILLNRASYGYDVHVGKPGRDASKVRSFNAITDPKLAESAAELAPRLEEAMAAIERARGPEATPDAEPATQAAPESEVLPPADIAEVRAEIRANLIAQHRTSRQITQQQQALEEINRQPRRKSAQARINQHRRRTEAEEKLQELKDEHARLNSERAQILNRNQVVIDEEGNTRPTREAVMTQELIAEAGRDALGSEYEGTDPTEAEPEATAETAPEPERPEFPEGSYEQTFTGRRGTEQSSDFIAEHLAADPDQRMDEGVGHYNKQVVWKLDDGDYYYAQLDDSSPNSDGWTTELRKVPDITDIEHYRKVDQGGGRTLGVSDELRIIDQDLYERQAMARAAEDRPAPPEQAPQETPPASQPPDRPGEIPDDLPDMAQVSMEEILSREGFVYMGTLMRFKFPGDTEETRFVLSHITKEANNKEHLHLIREPNWNNGTIEPDLVLPADDLVGRSELQRIDQPGNLGIWQQRFHAVNTASEAAPIADLLGQIHHYIQESELAFDGGRRRRFMAMERQIADRLLRHYDTEAWTLYRESDFKSKDELEQAIERVGQIHQEFDQAVETYSLSESYEAKRLARSINKLQDELAEDLRLIEDRLAEAEANKAFYRQAIGEGLVSADGRYHIMREAKDLLRTVELLIENGAFDEGDFSHLEDLRNLGDLTAAQRRKAITETFEAIGFDARGDRTVLIPPGSEILSDLQKNVLVNHRTFSRRSYDKDDYDMLNRSWATGVATNGHFLITEKKTSKDMMDKAYEAIVKKEARALAKKENISRKKAEQQVLSDLSKERSQYQPIDYEAVLPAKGAQAQIIGYTYDPTSEVNTAVILSDGDFNVAVNAYYWNLVTSQFPDIDFNIHFADTSKLAKPARVDERAVSLYQGEKTLKAILMPLYQGVGTESFPRSADQIETGRGEAITETAQPRFRRRQPPVRMGGQPDSQPAAQPPVPYTRGDQPRFQRRLKAVHNLSAANLIHAAEIGGLPAPSLAVTAEDIPFEDYGEITLIGPSDMVDPQRGGRTFDSDAYTSRSPRAKYHYDTSSLKQLMSRVEPAYEAVDDRMGIYAIEEQIKVYDKGLPELVNMLSDTGRSRHAAGMMLAYVRSRGKDVRPVTKKEIPDDSFLRSPAMAEWMADNDALSFLQSTDSLASREGMDAWREAIAPLAEALKAASREWVIENMYEGDASAEGVAADADLMVRWYFNDDGQALYSPFNRLRRELTDLQDDTVKLDTGATEDKVARRVESLGKNNYQRWLRGQLEPIFGARYIESGRQRLPYTLDNLVRVMTANGVKGQEGTMTYSLAKARAMTAKEFSSLNAIRRDSDRLMDPDQFEQVKEELSDRFFDIQQRMSEYYIYERHWDALDDASKSMADFMKKPSKTGTARMQAVLAANGYKGVPGELAGELVRLAQDLRSGPTEYFESKPARGVRLDEFVGAVVPRGTDKAALQALRDAGVQIRYYDGTGPDRLQKTKAFQRAFFQREGQDPAGSGPLTGDRNGVAIAAHGIVREWTGAPEVVVYNTMAEFAEDHPELAVDRAEEVSGMFWGDRVYLFADQASTEADLRETLMHEAIGHYGLRGVIRQAAGPDSNFESDLNATLDDVVASHGDSRRFADLGRLYYRKDPSALSAAEKRVVAEELIAHMAQRGEAAGFVERIIQLVRRALSRLMGRELAHSDAELRVLVAQSAKFVRYGQRRRPGGGRQTPRFLYAGTEAEGYAGAEARGETFTGLYDGMERFEIYDWDAGLKPANLRWTSDYNPGASRKFTGPNKVFKRAQVAESLPLEAVLDHEELYESYPALKFLRVHMLISEELDPARSNGAYEFSNKDEQITVIAANPYLARLILLHEIQHKIQRIESFEQGADERSARQYFEYTYGDIISQNPAFQQLPMSKHGRRYSLAQEMFVRKFIAKKAGTWTYQQALEDAYWRFAGEVEARDVMERSVKRPADLQGTLPYELADISPDQAITYREDVGGIQPGDAEYWNGVQSPNFTAFFGDWRGDPQAASKVTGPAGAPLQLYPATAGGGGFVRQRGRTGQPDLGLAGQGWYFTPDPEAAARGGQATFADVRNPFVIEDGVVEGFDYDYHRLMADPQLAEAFRRDLAEAGHDGVIIRRDGQPAGVITYNPRQAKAKGSDFNPAASADADDVRFRRGRGFYSKLEDTIESKLSNNQPARQVLKNIEAWNRKGEFKTEELEWSGLVEWLESQSPDYSVPKQQIMDYLRSTRIELVEHHKVQDAANTFKRAKDIATGAGYQVDWKRLPDDTVVIDIYDLDDELIGEDYTDSDPYVNDALEALRSLANADSTEHDDYILPGGQNYRELVLALPRTGLAERRQHGTRRMATEYEDELAAKYGEDFTEQDLSNEELVRRNQLRLNRATVSNTDRAAYVKYRENLIKKYGLSTRDLYEVTPKAVDLLASDELDQLEKLRAEAEKQPPPQSPPRRYTHRHWSEENPLGHVRFQDHYDAAGNRVLTLDEIQSDWHQEGRETGYRTDFSNGIPQGWTMKEVAPLENLGSFPNTNKVSERKGSGRWALFDNNGDFVDNTLADSKEEASKTFIRQVPYSGYNSSKVPDAPFKTTWHELMVRRMLRHAVENGYDKMAWTPGAIHNERYGLNKFVDRLEYDENDETLRGIKDGRPIITEDVAPDELGSYIGKEAAKKLLDSPLEQPADKLSWVEGEDWEVREDYSSSLVNAENGDPEPTYYTYHFETGRESGRYQFQTTARREGAYRLKGYVAAEKGLLAPVTYQYALEGEELEVGGEGMKGFYDKMIPRYVSKYVKKWGAKVAPIQLDTEPQKFLGQLKYDGPSMEPMDVEAFIEDNRRELDINEKMYLRRVQAALYNGHQMADAFVAPLEGEDFAGETDRAGALAKKLGGTLQKTGKSTAGLERAVDTVNSQQGLGVSLFGKTSDGSYHQYFNAAEVRKAFDKDPDIKFILAKQVRVYDPDGKKFSGPLDPFEAFEERAFRDQEFGKGHYIAPVEETAEVWPALSDRQYTPVLAVDITPEMRRSITTEGQPLFRRIPLEQQSTKYGAGPRTDNFIRYWQDRLVDLKRLQEGKRAEGGVLDDATNAYRAETLSYGKIEAKRSNFDRDIAKPLIEHVGAITRTHGVSVDDVREYLKARHAPERNALIAKRFPDRTDPGAGMTNSEADAIQRGFLRDVPDAAAIRRLHDLVKRATDFTIDQWQEGGLISEDRAGELRTLYEHYVPLRGFKDAEYDPTVFSFDEEARGRTSESGDPLAYTFAMADTAIIRAEQNKVKQRLLEFVKANPDPAVYTLRNVYFKRTGEMRDHKVVWEEVFGQPTAGELARGDAKRMVDFDTEAIMKKEMGEGSTLGVYQNGRMVAIDFAEPQIARAFKRLDTEQVPRVLEGFRKYMNLLRNAYTQYNPEFSIRNLIRDSITGFINIRNDFGVKEANAIVNPVAMGKAFSAIRAGIRGDDYESKGWSAAYKEFRDLGAMTGYWNLDTITDRQRRLERQIEQAGDPIAGSALNPKNMVREAFGFIDEYNKVLENVVRLSAFKRLKESGRTPEQAAEYAKDLTVNFNRKGNVSDFFGSLYLFFNASMQGSARLLQPFFSPGKVRRRALSSLAGIPLGAIAWSMMLRATAGKDEDEEYYYDKMNPYTRTHYLMFPNFISEDEGDFFKLPLPYGFNVYYALGDHAARYMLGKESAVEASVNTFATALDSFSPVGAVESETFEGAILKTLAPTVGAPVVELAINEDFAGRPIMPNQFPGQDHIPDSERKFEGVNPVADAIAVNLNKAFGGDEVVSSGPTDISPETLEYLGGYYGGGLVNFINGALSTVQTVATNGPLTPFDPDHIYQTPFARSFYSATSGYHDVAQFYKHLDEVEGRRRQHQEYLERGEREKAADFFEQNRSQMSLSQRAKAIQSQLRKLRRSEKALKKQPESPVQQQTLARIAERERELYRQFNKAYNTQTKASAADFLDF